MQLRRKQVLLLAVLAAAAAAVPFRDRLALRVNYPNRHDRRRGAEDGRAQLGGDIMIHGNTCSIGCLAMGDEAAEDLFVLAAETGIENITVLLCPLDLRTRPAPAASPGQPAWVNDLYRDLAAALREFPIPAAPRL